MFKENQKVEICPAKQSLIIDAELQLSLLTKAEKVKRFRAVDHREIIRNYSVAEVNAFFKDALKLRYKKRWAFVKAEWSEILPCDLQFFFNKNISPELIYSV
jgi:hypothetical protein